MKNQAMLKWGVLVPLVITGCSTMQTLIGVQDPELSVKDVTIERMTFDKADLLFNLEVYNPNSINAKLSGFDYAFSIDETKLVNGTQEQEVYVPKKSTSAITVPLTLSYRDIYSTIQKVADQETFDYTMLIGMRFELPVIGDTTIPISYRGTMPVVHLPTFSVNSLTVDRMNMSGADLLLKVGLKNPNAFSMVLDNLHYTFAVNDQNWAKGIIREPINIKTKDSTSLSIPVTLDFLSMGKTVYEAITDRKPLRYDFDGVGDVTSSLDIMKKATIPLTKTGEINLTR